jgi:transcriptional regulator with XRE-family HTH domain
MSDLEVRIGKRLQQTRRARGVSLAALATAVGVSELHLAAVEHGTRRLEPRDLISACSFLDATIEEFMYGI